MDGVLRCSGRGDLQDGLKQACSFKMFLANSSSMFLRHVPSTLQFTKRAPKLDEKAADGGLGRTLCFLKVQNQQEWPAKK